MSVQTDLAGLSAQAIVEMFVYDDTNIGGAQVVRWHPGTTVAGAAITWQGNVYSPFPIEATGFAIQSSGSPPRPSLKASNIGGVLGAYLRTMSDGVGAKVTRKRTLGKYLDAVNFSGGNANADPSAGFPDDVFFISRKASENAIFIEMELAVSYDVSNVFLPRRQVIASTCTWVYRSAECGYAGPPVQDILGNPTSNANLDKCRKTLAACRARFGQNGILNTAAFPASQLVSGT
jgi:lambda family phage minor tail protein L